MEKGLRELQMVELGILKEFIRICKKHNLRYYCIGGTLLGAVRHKGFIPWDDDIDVGMPRPDFIRFEQIVRQEIPGHLRYYNYRENPEYKYYFSKMTDSRLKVIDASACVPAEREAWIDIFPLDGMPKNCLKRRFHCMRLLIARMRLNYSMFSTNVDIRRDRNLHERLLIKIGTLLPVEKILNTPKEFARLDRLMQKYSFDDSEYVVNFMGIYKLKEMFHKKIYGKGAWYPFEDIRVWGPENYDYFLTQMYGDYRKPPSKKERNHHNTRMAE